VDGVVDVLRVGVAILIDAAVEAHHEDVDLAGVLRDAAVGHRDVRSVDAVQVGEGHHDADRGDDHGDRDDGEGAEDDPAADDHSTGDGLRTA